MGVESDRKSCPSPQTACFREQIEVLARQVKALEKALHPKLLPDEQIQHLLWIPGLGMINAFTIRQEIDDFERFVDATLPGELHPISAYEC